MAKKTTPAPATENKMVRWDEKLAELAAAATKIEENVGGGNMIGTKGGVLSYKGNPVPGNNLDVVVVDHIAANLFYGTRFDPNNPQPPVCYAFARDEADLKPHEKSTDPQHEMCKGCPNNEWASADTGRGKACKNTRRLALIPESDLTDPVNAETAYFHPPVTSVKSWAGFVKQVAESFNRPPLGVIVNISLVPDPKTQFKAVFKLKQVIDDSDTIGALIEKNRLVSSEIMFPYMPMESAPAPPAKAPANAKWARKGK